jgi:cobalt-zinc-cadmium efflux system membrane fusion protein
MRNRLRVALTLSLNLFGAATIAWLGGCGPSEDHAADVGTPVRASTAGLVRLTSDEASSAGLVVQTAARVEYRSHRDFPGTVSPNQHALAEITALVRGRVIDVYADLGQEVKAGSLLALLNSGELGMAQSAYLKASAKLYVAERAYRRAQALLEEKVIGLAEAQRREGEMISTRAEKRESHDRLLLLGMTDEDIRKMDRDQTIRSYVPILAPFDGRVINRNLTKGEVVETTEKLFAVADLSEVWVLGNIPEKDIPFIRHEGAGPSQKIEILLNAYPNEVFHGTITYVGDVLEARTRTMNLRIEVKNPDRKLKPEMFATIRVYSDPEKNVLAVPEQAIQRERDRKFVFVQRDEDTYEVRDVSLGESNGEMVKVLDGLREGDKIVTAGAFILKSELLGEQL